MTNDPGPNPHPNPNPNPTGSPAAETEDFRILQVEKYSTKNTQAEVKLAQVSVADPSSAA